MSIGSSATNSRPSGAQQTTEGWRTSGVWATRSTVHPEGAAGRVGSWSANRTARNSISMSDPPKGSVSALMMSKSRGARLPFFRLLRQRQPDPRQRESSGHVHDVVVAQVDRRDPQDRDGREQQAKAPGRMPPIEEQQEARH